MTGAATSARSPGFAAPLRACDRVTTRTGAAGVRVSGHTRVRGDGPYLSAHFPEVAIFPGVFVLEAVVQAVAEALGRSTGGMLRLAEIRSLRLLVPLHPGDRLVFDADVAGDGGAGQLLVTADCRRGDGIRVAGMTLVCGWSP